MSYEDIRIAMHNTSSTRRIARIWKKIKKDLSAAYEYEYIKAQKRYDSRALHEVEARGRRISSSELLNVEKDISTEKNFKT